MNNKLKILFLGLFLNFQCAYGNDFGINLNWFDNFHDENLKKCIYEALSHNKDIQIARKNILKLRQETNLNISKEMPNVNVGSDYLLLKVPKTAIPNNDIQTNSYALPFNVQWEVDYLLKNYNQVQKSRLDEKNSYLELKASNLMVVSDVASFYFNISKLNEEIEKQTKIKDNSYQIFLRKRKMFDYGVISSIELNKAEENYLEEKNKCEILYTEKERFLTSLLYYMGKTPSNRDLIKITHFGDIDFKGVYPETLKGDIIQYRPDVSKMENELEKAKIDITIAKKEFLPQINIIGLMVFSTFVQNFGWDGVFAALLAGATQNIFDGGKRVFTLKKRKAEYELMVENFLKTDLNALKEVNDALFKVKTDYKVYENEKMKLNLSNSNFKKVSNSFNKGTKSYIDYLDENILFLKNDISYQNSKNQNFTNLLTLYKAVGGAL